MLCSWNWRLVLLDVPSMYTCTPLFKIVICVQCALLLPLLPLMPEIMECATHSLFCFCCYFFILHARSSINIRTSSIYSLAKLANRMNWTDSFVRTYNMCVPSRVPFNNNKKQRWRNWEKEREWHLRRLFANGGSIWNSCIRCCYYSPPSQILLYIHKNRLHQSKWLHKHIIIFQFNYVYNDNTHIE